ncbi:MAG TPA: ABC transporter ATP-binding protein [Candidatus Limnocylindria bacterium]|nr:ABC transporter ATP-binding protein [Candidatus Limnocylindria bacterium]
MDENVIDIRGLVKKFGKFRALDGLDLSVARGEVHGLLGPNGAGKSTTIRVLLGLLDKSGGAVRILGGDPKKDAVHLHRRLAYVPGEVNLWPNLSGGESIDLLGALRGGLDQKRRADLLERFQLDPRKKFRTYSKGNRQKVALVAALASDVDLYILDEPTSGLDPLMEAVFQECIKELKVAGKTILLASHILAEAEALCDRLTIIREGKAIQTGTLHELRHLHRTTIKARTEKPVSGLGKLPGVHNLHLEGEHHVEFEVDSHNLDAALEHLTKLNVRSLTSHPPTLEELFLLHYSTGGKK